MKPVTRYLGIVAWLAAWLGCVYVLARWAWFVMMDVLVTPSLAYIAAGVFVAFALFAGPPRRVRKGGRFVAVLQSLSLAAAFLTLLGVYGLRFVRDKVEKGYPVDLAAAMSYAPPTAVQVYSDDDELMCTFTLTNRVRVPFARFPKHVRDAVLAAEDADFYRHSGIDPVSLGRALLVNTKLWFKARGNADRFDDLLERAYGAAGVTGNRKQGGSTITSQVAKMLFLSPEKSIWRKVREAFLAIELTRKMSKDDVLAIYMNHVFLGNERYGMPAAAKGYFSKEVEDLSLPEAAMLAGLPQAPTKYSPSGKNYDAARARMRYVLDQMVRHGFIMDWERDNALKESIVLVSSDQLGSHFCQLVRSELRRRYPELKLVDAGLTVRTTLRMDEQRAATWAVQKGILEVERRVSFVGPVSHDDSRSECVGEPLWLDEDVIYTAYVVEVGTQPAVCVNHNLVRVHPDDARRIAAWERRSKTKLQPGDSMPVMITREARGKHGSRTPYAISARRTGGPEERFALEGVLVSVEPSTGFIRAYVGGYDYDENNFDNASMGRGRQPGSSIKMLVACAALQGNAEVPPITVDTLFIDRLRTYVTASGPWKTENFENKYKGEVTLKKAISLSLNSVFAELTDTYGPHAVISCMRQLGYRIEAPEAELERARATGAKTPQPKVEPVLPLAVGAAEVTPLEHTMAYAQVAALGKKFPSHPDSDRRGIFILKVEAQDGTVLYEYTPTPQEPWPQAIPSAVAYELLYMMKGVVEGGTAMRAREIGHPAFGKTGTSTDHKQVWFVGGTTDRVTSVAVWRRTPATVGPRATGGAVALPIWLSYMKTFYALHKELPPRDFRVPDDVILLRNDRGELTPYQRGRVPDKYLHARADEAAETEGIFTREKSPFLTPRP